MNDWIANQRHSYVAVRQPWRTDESCFLVVYWALSSLQLVLTAKVGAGSNYWIEFAAATSILAARGAACVLSARRPGIALAGAAGLILVLGVRLGGLQGALDHARTIRANVQATLAQPPHVEFDALVDRVRHEPGGVLAERMDVIVLAGRPVLLEPFIYNLLLQAGRWRADLLATRICNGQIGLLVLGPAPILAALQNSMT